MLEVPSALANFTAAIPRSRPSSGGSVRSSLPASTKSRAPLPAANATSPTVTDEAALNPLPAMTREFVRVATLYRGSTPAMVTMASLATVAVVKVAKRSDVSAAVPSSRTPGRVAASNGSSGRFCSCGGEITSTK